MQSDTPLAKLISTAGERAAYDNACKRLLSNREILAWIMKSCLSEYRDCSIQQIAYEYIEGEPQISQVAVHRDESTEIPTIKGENTEDTSINEGTVTYDIRFRAIAPVSGETISLIIDVEAQNDFYPGYPLITRGIYYCCRMISAQHTTDFTNSNYQEIKKVYSIFICMNPPKYRKNTINRYSIREEKLFGDVDEEISAYDLITAIIICIGDSDNSSGILRLLEVLLSPEKTGADKKQILQDEFAIKMTEDFKEEVFDMCNLSKGIEEKGMRTGIFNSICNLMDTMNLAADKAMDALKIPSEDRLQYMELLKHK